MNHCVFIHHGFVHKSLTEHEMVEAEEANCFIPIELNGEDNVN